MIDYRIQHAIALMRQQRAMNAARRELSDAVARAITERCGDRPTYDIGCHHAVARDIDTILDRYYGKRRGDESGVFYRIITGQALAAIDQVMRLSRQIVSRHLTRSAPDVLAYLKDRGKNRGL